MNRLISLYVMAVACAASTAAQVHAQSSTSSNFEKTVTLAANYQAGVWLDESSRLVAPGQAILLKRAQATLLGNIVHGDAWKPYPGIMPSLGTYRGVWNWDSAFHAIGVSQWDPALAREQIDILFDKQQTNGMIPDMVMEEGRVGLGHTKPPVMAWAVAVVDKRSPDLDYIRKLYPKLVRWGDFWLEKRGGHSDGLFFYAGSHAGNDSGWDNSIRWDGGYKLSQSNDMRLWAIDLNCYMVAHYRALAYLAGRLGSADDQAKWLHEASSLAKRINDRLWDNQLGSYVDRDRQSGKASSVLSPACFMPLFIHIAPPDRAGMMAKLAADPQKFLPGMPTAAYDTPGFNPRDIWRGPTWLNTSFFALKGLKDYGYAAGADTMRATMLDWVAKDHSALREYYDSKTGEGLAARGFGWTAVFTISFILDWDNDHLTWLFQSSPNE